MTAVAGASVRLVLVGILGGSWLFDQKGCTQLKQLAMNASHAPRRSGRGRPMVRADSEPFWQLRRRQQELGVHLTRRRGVLIGLLIAAIFVGSIDVALRSSFVTGPQPQKEKPAFAKIQDRLIAVVEPETAKEVQTSIPREASKPLQASNHSDSKPGIGVAAVEEAFTVSNIHPTDGFITASTTHPASSTQQDSAASPTFMSAQSRIAAEPRVISPLPRRKPKSTKEAQSTTAEQKPMDQEQGLQMPKPMAFGSIGYNYDPQR